MATGPVPSAIAAHASREPGVGVGDGRQPVAQGEEGQLRRLGLVGAGLLEIVRGRRFGHQIPEPRCLGDSG